MTALLKTLLEDPSQAAQVPRQLAIPLLLELARVQRALELFMISAPAPEQVAEDAWMTVDDVMALTGLSRRTVYARASRHDWRPFAERAGRKTLRFRAGLRRLLLAPNRA